MTATIAEVEFRVARGRDARALARLIVVCLATYRDWAPDGWRLPASIELRELAGWNRRLRSERQRTLIACDPAGEIIGIVSWGPLAGQPAPDASTAHVDHLFVAPDYWGAGLARLLHERALAEMRARGFHHAQLYSAVGNTRAERFYEREGWTATPDRLALADLKLSARRYERRLEH